MKLSEVISRLQTIYENEGDCEVLRWTNIIYGSSPVLSIEYRSKDQLNKDLENDLEYIKNFNTEVGNVIIM